MTGIGPEVALKALAAGRGADDAGYLLLGDVARTRQLNQKLGLGLPLETPGGASPHPTPGKIFLHDPAAKPLPAQLVSGSASVAQAAVACLQDGAARCLRGELAALVTAPVNKEAIIRSGFRTFVGQTELLSELAGTGRTAMMLLGHDERGRWLRVALVTIHLPLRRVAESLRGEKIGQVIELAAQACRDLGLGRARIGVCGLNPHAGEGGEMGDEEITTITPAIRAAQARGCDVHGPLPGDTVFHQAWRGDYDAVVAMYHDQGLAPLKLIGFDTGVNWTLGLPFIRTSPDHGTAYDIAGQGKANPSSMMAALRLAKQLAAARR